MELQVIEGAGAESHNGVETATAPSIVNWNFWETIFQLFIGFLLQSHWLQISSGCSIRVFIFYLFIYLFCLTCICFSYPKNKSRCKQRKNENS
jgi:membrane-anchored protein YejM (alkaline phosphatase superfamily)